MFRCLATSSSTSLSQTHVKVQNSFAFVMVSGQLIYFHLEISQKLLIYLDHLKISRHPAKKTLGVLLCTRISEESQSPLWRVGGGGGRWCVPESERTSHTEHLARTYQGGVVFSSGLTWFRLHLCLPGLLPVWRQDRPQGVSQQEVLVSLGIYLYRGANGIQWVTVP